MSKRAWLFAGIISLLVGIGILAKKAIDNITYTFGLKGFSVLRLNITGDSRVRIDLAINVINKNPFKITISNLYYEVFYKGSLLAESAEKTLNEVIEIPANGLAYTFNQSVEVHVNRNNLAIIQNYMSKTPIDFTINVKAKAFGIPFKLNNIKFSY